MAGIAAMASRLLADILSGETGLGTVSTTNWPQSGDPGMGLGPLKRGNVAADLAERGPIRYPAIYLYCDRLSNTLREKFRTFAGTARLNIEIRASQEKLEGIEERLQDLSESVLAVLHTHRGDWGGGVYYSGLYELSLSPVKAGGKGFLQTAKIQFEVSLSID